MTRIRFIIDDVGQCRTQRAILAGFAAALAHYGDVVCASALTLPTPWVNVPAESARRLALRLYALAPTGDQVTVFLPGHTIPGVYDWSNLQVDGLIAEDVATLGELDFFIFNNSSLAALSLTQLVATEPSYDVLSSYWFLAEDVSPAQWHLEGSLVSARSYNDRPWYSAYARYRVQWLNLLASALETGRLDSGTIREDCTLGLARPSLLLDLAALQEQAPLQELPDTTLDALFVYPECALPLTQRRLLVSRALQKRTLAYANRHKKTKQPAFIARLKRLPRQAYRLAYSGYRMSLRPIVHYLRGRRSA